MNISAFPWSEYTLHSDINIFTHFVEIVLHKVVYVITRNTLWSQGMFYQVPEGLRIVSISIQVYWAILSGIKAGAPGGAYRKSFLV